MSQKITCETHAGNNLVIRELTGEHACFICAAPALKVIDTTKTTPKTVQAPVKTSEQISTENIKAFDAMKEAQEISKSLDMTLPRDWVIVNWGIPQTAANLRYQLCLKVQSLGFVSRDLGGSFYVGPASTKLDQLLIEYVQKLRLQLGAGSYVRVIRQVYSEENARIFADDAITGALNELKHLEESIDELERASVGEITLKDADGKERKVSSYGPGRIRSAKRTLEDLDALIQRFQGTPALEKAADSIKLHAKEAGAYVEKVESKMTERIVAEKMKGVSKLA